MSLSFLGIFVGLIWLFGDFQIPYELDDFVDARRRRHEEWNLTRWEVAGPKRAGQNAIPEAVAVPEWDGRYENGSGVLTAREFDLLMTKGQ